jgi:outer membrane protein assembly factor BamD
MKKSLTWLPVLLALFALTFSAGCGLFGGRGTPDSQAFDTPAQVLANDAELQYKDGKYEEAADLYQQLKDRFPYSRYALLADLRVGDAYFKSKRYDEAVLAYDDFIRLHPKNDAVPYAIYQMGMVYHEQMLIPARDPTSAKKASDTFQRLLRQYPKSEWAVKARPRLQEALERMAAHDMFVGKFYLKTSRFRAAIGRFKRVLTNYPDVGLYGEALTLIKQSEQKLAELPPEERGRDVSRPDLERALPYTDTGMPDVLDESVVSPPIGGIGSGI